MTADYLKWAGIVLILLTGLIHFIEAPGHMGEEAMLAWMFILNGIGSLLAAYAIYKRQIFGWLLGLLIAGGAIAGYFISRTMGMPGMQVEEADAVGVTTVILEILFILAAVLALARRSTTAR